MPFDVGSATGYLLLDSSGFMKGLSSAGKELDNFSGSMSSKLQSAGTSLSKAGSTLTKSVTVPLLGLGGVAVKTAASFESSMSQVQATLGATEDSVDTLDGATVNTMDSLSALAQELGASTKFSATEAAAAINNMAMAGYNVQEIYDSLPSVLSLASAGAIDLDYATQLVANGLNVMGLETADATELADKLAVTSTKAYGSVSDFGEGLLVAGAQAKLANVDLTDTMTALGILGDNGISASEGGTYLRNTLKNLYTPTKEAATALEELGVTTAEDDGTLRDFQDVLKDLGTALDDLTPDERIKAMSKIFDSRTISAANALIANSSERWDELSEAIDGAAGSAKNMADTQLDNLNGQITILKSSLEGMAIAFGNLILPLVKKVVSTIQSIIDWVNNLDESQKAQILRILEIVAAVGPALLIGGKIVSTLGKLGKAFSLLSSPLGLVLAAIATLVVAFGDLGGLSDSLGGIFKTVQDTLSSVAEKIPDILKTVIGAIEAAFPKVVEAFQQIFPKILDTLVQIITSAIPKIVDLLKKLIPRAISTVISLINQAIPLLLDAAMSLFTALVDTLPDLIPLLVEAFVLLIDAVVNSVQSWLPKLLEAIKKVLDEIIKLIPKIVPKLVEAIPAILQAVVNALMEAAPLLLDAAIDLFMALAQALPVVVQQLIPYIPVIVSTIVQVLMDNFPVLLQGAIDLFMALIEAIPQICTELLSALPQIVETFLTGLLEPLLAMFGSLWEGITSIFDDAGGWFDENVIQPVVKIFTALWESISSLASSCWDAIVGVWKIVTSWFKTNIVDPVKGAFTGVWDSLKQGASKAWEGIKSVFKAIPTWFKNVFTSAWQKVKDVFSTGGKIFSGIKDGIVEAFKTVVNAIIKGINKVIAIPFNTINGILNWIREISILGIEPFAGLWGYNPLSVPQIPLLAKGGVLKQGQVGLLEGDGAEAVVPLEKNTEWIKRVASELYADLQALLWSSGLMDSVKSMSESIQEVVSDIRKVKENAETPQSIHNEYNFYSPTAIDPITARKMLKQTAQQLTL